MRCIPIPKVELDCCSRKKKSFWTCSVCDKRLCYWHSRRIGKFVYCLDDIPSNPVYRNISVTL